MADIAAQLQAIADKPDQKQKLEDYKQLLQRLLAAPSVDTCNAFVDHSTPGTARGAGAAVGQPAPGRAELRWDLLPHSHGWRVPAGAHP
jgi:hypothetical protein